MTSNDDSERSADTGGFEFANDGSRAASERPDGLLGRVGEQLNSRRGFMGNAAKVGAGALALGAAGSGTVSAAHGDRSYVDSQYERDNPHGYGALANDQIVKFALLLERLEATFYTEAVGDEPVGEGGGSVEGGINYNNPGTIGDILQDEGSGELSEIEVELSSAAYQFLSEPHLQNRIFEYFQIIRDHEQAHVAALEGVLEEIGADPSYGEDFTFSFPYSSADQFIGVARALEDTGAGAYTAAAPAIDIEEYLASAAQIALIEGRHASYLRTLTDTPDDIPFFAQDMPLQPQLGVAGAFNNAAPFIDGVDPVDEGDHAAAANALFEDGYAPDRSQ